MLTNRMKDFKPIQERWATLTDRLYRDPKITALMSTGIGKYLDSHPILALSVLVFSVLAAIPVGLFLVFALITSVVTAVGCAVFEVFLLSVGGMALLFVLSGMALLSLAISSVLSACSATTSITWRVLFTPHTG
ncbi:unnamed protein product [Lota lota]